MSRHAERLARAEEKLAAIKAGNSMQVVIDRYGGGEPQVIDYAKDSYDSEGKLKSLKPSKPSPSSRKTKRTKGRT